MGEAISLPGKCYKFIIILMKLVSVVKAQRSPYYLLDRLGILDWVISRRKKEGSLPLYILSYHRFSPFKEIIPSIPSSVAQASFGEQIAYLCRNFQPVPLSFIAHCIHQKKPFPKNAITITIDDGYKDNYFYAYPILKKYGVPATIFLATSYIGGLQTPWEAKISFAISHTSLKEIFIEGIGKFALENEKKKYIATKLIIKRLKKFSHRRKNLLIEELLRICGAEVLPDLGEKLMLSWEEIKEMSENGIEFGAHTLTHPELTRMPLWEAKEEIERSKREIEEKLGKPVISFAYPSGLYNEEVVELVRRAGFLCAVTTNLEEVKPWSNPYKLGRATGIDEDFPKFKAILSGIYYKINTCWGLIS